MQPKRQVRQSSDDTPDTSRVSVAATTTSSNDHVAVCESGPQLRSYRSRKCKESIRRKHTSRAEWVTKDKLVPASILHLLMPSPPCIPTVMAEKGESCKESSRLYGKTASMKVHDTCI